LLALPEIDISARGALALPLISTFAVPVIIPVCLAMLACPDASINPEASLTLLIRNERASIENFPVRSSKPVSPPR
jgi:hypothetical protein